MSAEIAERFARDTAEHEMTILHDDGLYRHLRFMQPKSSSYWFDLITVPGALIFQGAGDSYVFRRMTDMFEFFRSGIWEDGSLHINPHYWAEKLTGDCDSVMKYDQNLFEQQVKEHVAEAIKERTAPRGISRAIRDLLENGDITWEGGARRALEEFEHSTKAKVRCTCGNGAAFREDDTANLWRDRHLAAGGSSCRATVTPAQRFTFEDAWEWSFKDYDWWFLWALHGIVWGISQYDSKRAELVAAGAGESRG